MNEQIVWNPELMQRHSGVVEWTGWDGKPIYQCAACYQRSLTAASPQLPMISPPRHEPPAGTQCACGVFIRPPLGVVNW